MKNPSVIIIKKPKRDGHGGHHGGAWKVAYADFVTAMMAFFLVMWLVSQSKAVKAGVSGYFRDPGIFDFEKSNSPIPGGSFKLDENMAETIRVDPKDPALAAAGRKALEEAAARLKTVLGELPEFDKLEHQIEIQLTPEGLRIELVEDKESTFFDSGSATLKGATEHILGTIATELGKLENSVVIEGHTDSRPYSDSRSYTNWELSADRANAARRVMEASGLHTNQILAVRGYADRQLRNPKDPYDSQNRRVSIVVQNQNLGVPTAMDSSDLTSMGRSAAEADSGPAASDRGGHDGDGDAAADHEAAPKKAPETH